MIFFIHHLFPKNPPGQKFVYDIKSSRIVADEVQRLGGIPLVERSGHTYIKTRLIREDAIMAGEISAVSYTHLDVYKRQANDGTVEFRAKERTNLAYIVQKHQIGDDLNLKILRNGKVQNLSVNLSSSYEKNWLIPYEQMCIRDRVILGKNPGFY